MVFGRRATTPLEKRLGHRFKRPDLLQLALTHRSYANEQGVPEHYERLVALLGGRKRPIVWDTRDDPRAVQDLRRDASLLALPPRAGRVLRISDAAEHAYLRAHDPGAWPDVAPRPPLSVARRVGDALVPARSARASPRVWPADSYR